MKSFGITGVPITRNLVDMLWSERPTESLQKLLILPVEECGEEITDKLIRVRVEMKKQKCDLLLVNSLDDIACKFKKCFQILHI